MKFVIATAALAGLMAASTAHAATITYTLSLNDSGTHTYSAGSYAVYASDTNDNSGLQSIAFSLAGETTIANRSPRVTFTNNDGSGNDLVAGFTLLRTANIAGETTGAQDLISGGSVNAYGIGQQAGNLTSVNPSPANYTNSSTTSGAYALPVLVANGTYGTVTPTFTATGGSVFTDTAGDVNLTPNSTSTTVTLAPVPEPASLAVLAIGAIGVLRRRRIV